MNEQEIWEHVILGLGMYTVAILVGIGVCYVGIMLVKEIFGGRKHD